MMSFNQQVYKQEEKSWPAFDWRGTSPPSYAERVITTALNISETSRIDWWFPCVIQVANNESYYDERQIVRHNPSLSDGGRTWTK